MRITLGLSLLALAAASPALAQGQYAPPPGPYQRQCGNIQMNGQMMSATCRGAGRTGNSTINILSCSTAISVDADGGLTCAGPGGGAPPSVRDAPPGYAVAPGQTPNAFPNGPGNGGPRPGGPGYGDNRPGYGDNRPGYGDNRPGYGDNRPGYGDNRPGYGDNRPGYGDNRPGYGRDGVTLFGARDWRGAPVRLDRPTPNLQGLGLNDQVRSIQFDRRSGPWIVCTDADYRGRCVTVSRSVSDVRQIGMRGQISSLRPIR